MKAVIPKFSLLEAAKLADIEPEPGDNYYLGSFSSPIQIDSFPRRATYFGIAICLKGSVRLTVGLEHYNLLPGSLIVMPPEVIRTWKDQSPDYVEETLLFKELFFLESGLDIKSFREFRFFQIGTPKVIQLNTMDSDVIQNLLQDIKKTITRSSKRRDEIVRSYVHILLNQIADLYDRYYPDVFTRLNTSLKMVSEFKKLLIEKHHYLRSVNGYADLLNVTAKHLSQTMQENTGSTAGEWIHNILILEAKVMLKQTSHTIAEISDSLNFSDPSSFGKYFRRYAGCSPASYRKL